MIPVEQGAASAAADPSVVQACKQRLHTAIHHHNVGLQASKGTKAKKEKLAGKEERQAGRQQAQMAKQAAKEVHFADLIGRLSP